MISNARPCAPRPVQIFSDADARHRGTCHLSIVTAQFDRVNGVPSRRLLITMQIHAAANSGNIECLKRQLARGVDVDADGDMTPLMLACETKDNHTAVELLIEAGANCNAISRSLQRPPLQIAVATGEPAYIQALLAAGADVHYVCPNGYNALTHSTFLENKERLFIVQTLLEAGCSPDQVSSYGESALRTAARSGHTRFAGLLLAHGADRELAQLSPTNWAVLIGSLDDVQREVQQDPTFDNADGSLMTPWLMAVCIGDLDKASYLLDAGSRTDVVGMYEQSALTLAAERGDSAMCRWIVSLSVNIHQADHLAVTPLQAAVGADDIETVEFLLESGASILNGEETDVIVAAKSSVVARRLILAGSDIDTIDPCGNWALADAARENEIQWVRELLALGADVDNTSTGATALHSAVGSDHRAVAKILLDAGANVDAQDVDGWTPLMFSRTLETLNLLLDWNASPDTLSGIGEEAVISQMTDPEMIDRLLEVQQDPQLVSCGLGNLLRNAAAEGNREQVNFLLSRGADTNSATSWGMTPLMAAAQHHQTLIVEHLIAHGAKPGLRDEDGRSAVTYAAAPECLVSFELGQEFNPEFFKQLAGLESRGLDLQSAEIQALEPPYGYFPSDDVSTLEALIELGADIEGCDNEGRTALLIACSCGRPSHVAALLRLGANREHRSASGGTVFDCVAGHYNRGQAEQIENLLHQSAG